MRNTYAHRGKASAVDKEALVEVYKEPSPIPNRLSIQQILDEAGGAPLPAGALAPVYQYGPVGYYNSPSNSSPQRYNIILQTTASAGNWFIGDGVAIGEVRRFTKDGEWGGSGSGVNLQNGNGAFYPAKPWTTMALSNDGQGCEVIWNGVAWEILNQFNVLTPNTNLPIPV